MAACTCATPEMRSSVAAPVTDIVLTEEDPCLGRDGYIVDVMVYMYTSFDVRFSVPLSIPAALYREPVAYISGDLPLYTLYMYVYMHGGRDFHVLYIRCSNVEKDGGTVT